MCIYILKVFIKDSETDFKNKYSKFLENNDLRKVNDEFVEELKRDQMKSKNRKKSKEELRAEYKHQIAFLLWSSIMVYFTYHFFVGWEYLAKGIAEIAAGRCNPSVGSTCGTFDIVCRFNGLGLGWFTKFSITHPVCDLFRNTIGNLISSLMNGDISLFARTASPILFPITLKKAIEKAVDFLFDCLENPELAGKVNKERAEMMQKYDSQYRFESDRAFGYEKWKAERAASEALASSSAVVAASANKSDVEMSAAEKRALAKAEKLKKKEEERILREEQKAHEALIKEKEKELKAQAKASAKASAKSYAKSSAKASAKSSALVSASGRMRSSNKTVKNVVAENRKVRVLSYGSVQSPEITKKEFEENLDKLGVLGEFKTIAKKVEGKTCKVMHGGDFGLFSVPVTLTAGLKAATAIKAAIHVLMASGTTYFNWGLFQSAYKNYGMNASSYLGTPAYAHTNFVLNLFGLGVKCQQGQSFFSHAAQSVFTGMSLYSLFALSSEIGNNAANSYENFSDYASKFYANVF